jgi:rhodanese-related sulfurtransferase
MKSYFLYFVLFMVQGIHAQFRTEPIIDFTNKDEGAILLDVRTPAEFREGHLEGALNLNWLDPTVFSEKLKGIPKEKVIYLYCKAGGRSLMAAAKLDSLGYKAVNLSGGYDAWKNRKRP